MSSPPLRVVVAGAGIAGLEALVALRSLAGHAVDLHLIAPDEDFSLRALSVFEPFGLARPQRYAIAEIADDLAAVHHHDAIRGVRLDDREADLRSGAVLPYDALLLAVGASAYPAFEYGACFDRAHERDAFDEVLDDVRLRMARRVAIVVPAGATWSLPAYELAFLLAADAPGTAVTIVTPEREPLEAFGAAAGAMLRDELGRAGVDLVCDVRAEVPGHTVVGLGGLRRLSVDRVIHLPSLAGPRPRGVPCDASGFIEVTDDFRIRGHEDAYAVGDGVAGPVKQGGLAAQQAGAVAARLAARAGSGRAPERFEPVLRALVRTGSGTRYLRSTGGDCVVSSQCLWWPPSKVASRWLMPWLAARDVQGVSAPAGGRG